MRDARPPSGWPLSRPPFHLETSLPGVFAVEDVRYGSVKRVASAVGEGAIAVELLHRYLAEPVGRGNTEGRVGPFEGS
jgi:thioredoxin reductase (NADPH)